MQVTPAMPACRAAAPGAQPIRWIAPDDAVERRLLASWCETVGPPAFHERGSPPLGGDTLVITWNVHAGAGDVRALLAWLRRDEREAGRSEPNVILLLQEAIRVGAAPARVPNRSPVPDRIEGRRAPQADVMDVARIEDLNAVYVPSMRNGAEGSNGRDGVPEDRGNAILSTLPMSDAAAMELPVSAQRRVAVAAQVSQGPGLHVVSVHLETSGAQGDQLSAVLDALSAMGAGAPLLVAGDFNSSMRRRALVRGSGVELHRVGCRGVTHRFFQLDHLLTSGLDVTDCTRLDRFGSDHAPLMVRLPRGPRLASGGEPE